MRRGIEEESVRNGMIAAVRIVSEHIATKRFSAVARKKDVAHKAKPETVTDADVEAEAAYKRLLLPLVPGAGFLGEESGLLDGENDYLFVVDPLDGTNAFDRRDVFGVSTMVALLKGTNVIAAYVGDVLTGDLFGYGPGSDLVSHWSRSAPVRSLPSLSLPRPANAHLLLGDMPETYGDAANRLLVGARDTLYRRYEIMHGSIGVRMSRLWTGAIGLALLKPGPNTPWDLAPVYGISHLLGLAFYNLDASLDAGLLIKSSLGVTRETVTCTYTILVAPTSVEPVVNHWFTTRGKI